MTQNFIWRQGSSYEAPESVEYFIASPLRPKMVVPVPALHQIGLFTNY